MKWRFILTLAATLVAAGSGPGRAVEVTLVPYIDGIVLPTDIAHAGDGRLFLVEQPGRILIADGDGQVLAEPFLDIRERVSCCGEQGLLGLAFHPNYASNGFFFVNYTDTQGDSRISRFSVSPGDPDVADPDSELVLLGVEQPNTNHNGGDLNFGPDGFLYIGLGDGGGAGDPFNAAQNRQSLLGKLLRIDVDGGVLFAIPPTNPFVGDPQTRDEIWALGLRNPWRFSFDRLSGDLYIADVGEGSREEVDFQLAASAGGVNYGWRCYEGNAQFNLGGCPATDELTFPVHDYGHDEGCSITGGIVYRGTSFPELDGHYFFGDLCSGRLWSLERQGPSAWQLNTFGQFSITPSTFGEDAAGEVYVADYAAGAILRVRPGCQAPGRSVLVLKAPGDSSRNKLVWKWLKGPATEQADFGDPVGGPVAYTLIVSDGASHSVLATGMDAGPAWRSVSSVGYKFSDSSASDRGVYNALLKGGAAGKAKILVKAKGAELPSPSLSLASVSKVTVQLFRNDDAVCWQADYPSTGIKATDTSLKARTK